MHITELVQHLEITRPGKHAFDYRLVSKALGYNRQEVTLEDYREIARRYSELDQLFRRACQSLIALAEDNKRLQAENDFMLRLVNSRMNTEDI